MFVKTLAAVCVLIPLGTAQVIAQEPLSWIGQKVASKYRYPVKVGNLITEEGSQHRTYTVTRTEGDWLWEGSESLRESLTVSQVIRFDEALDSFTRACY